MNLKQFQAAFALAKNPDVNLSPLNETFDGYGLREFQPVTTTIESVAALIRWQAMHIGHPKDSGPTFDEQELDNIRSIGRKKFIIAG